MHVFKMDESKKRKKEKKRKKGRERERERGIHSVGSSGSIRAAVLHAAAESGDAKRGIHISKQQHPTCTCFLV